MAIPTFTFKIDWYTFKQQGIPSNALNTALERNLTKRALSATVDIVRQFNADKADGVPTYRLRHLLASSSHPENPEQLRSFVNWLWTEDYGRTNPCKLPNAYQ